VGAGRTTGDITQDSCLVSETCAEATQLGNGVQAEISTFREAGCTLDGANFHCWSTDGEHLRMPIIGATAEAACAFSLELGRRNVDPTTLDATCEAPVYAETEAACSKTFVCGAKVMQTGSSSVYTLLNSYEDYAYCNASGSGPGTGNYWKCSCRDGDRSLSGVFRPETDSSSSACAATEQLCRPDITFQPAGSPSCQLANVTSAETSCTASQMCFQPGALAMTPVGVGAEAFTQCAQLQDQDGWECTCRSDYQDSNSFTVTNGTGIDVCMRAAANCEATAVYEGDAEGRPSFTFDIPAGMDDSSG
jgi:hypothetical protein